MERALNLEEMAGKITETQFSAKVPLSKKSVKNLVKSLPGNAGVILDQIRKGHIIPEEVTDEQVQKTIHNYLYPYKNECSGHPESGEHAESHDMGDAE